MTPSAEIVSTPSAEAAPIPESLAAIVPLSNYEEFYKSTTEEDRERIAGLLQVFAEIESSPAGIMAATARIALERSGYGMSTSTLHRLRGTYRKTGDWRVLKRNYRNGCAGQPEEFLAYFRMRVEQQKRDTGAIAVMSQIRDEWASGKAIPGYGTWREYHASLYPERDVPERFPYNFFPAGWGKSNLYKLQSSKAERKLARRGMAAAKAHLPHVIRDTSGLRFMELITIDDFETDILVQARNPVTGRYELTTCTGLLALDVATRTVLAFGLKPRFKAAAQEGERERKIAITRADVQFLLHSIFSEHGLPADWGVTILCENAAAAITDDVADMLHTLFGVQVARTGMLSEKVLANGFVPKGGKPWEKGWIESHFNIVGNHVGTLPGHKGASYELRPDDLAARILYAEKLLSTEGLTPAQIEQLQTGFFTADQALTAYRQILTFLERRTQHRMQGFLEICDYSIPGEAGLLPMAEAQRLPRELLEVCTPVPRKESPAERKERLTQGMRRLKIAEHALALLLLTPKRCTLMNHRITFTHLGEGFTFSEAGSPVLSLPEGTDLLGYFDPGRPDRLYCCKLDGRYVGPIKRRGAVDIRDAEAIAAERGEVTKIITQHVLAPVRARHAAEDSALARMKAENEAKLAAWGCQSPDPDTGKRRESISAQLQSAVPAAPHHVAAADGLAVGIAQAGREIEAEQALQAQEKSLAQRLQARARRLTAEDAREFLSQEKPDATRPAPAPTAEDLRSIL